MWYYQKVDIKQDNEGIIRGVYLLFKKGGYSGD